MFDQKTLFLALSSLAVGVAIGGAILNNWLPAETASTARMGDVQFAQAQTEPQLTQAERDFMDFTMPDLSKPQAGDETTRHGCVKPQRPQWAMELPPAEARKSLFLTDLYNGIRFQKILETNSCPCEVEWPSWDEADWQYQQITEGKSDAEVADLGREAQRQASTKRFDALTICSQSRGQ
ncbi:hypothetical protein [Paracoccus marcusii]|uniref:hypothetical protein n=1 Tax=Paracoccus marcusii TaxID=59779 RepID=UPI001C3CC27F|nr:hypothetical protein [Paracoccus marcusii]